MNKIILILGIVVLFGCAKPQISSQIVACPGIYTINGTADFTISTDKQAFNFLKAGRTYDSQNNMWVEDLIPADMTAEEAIQKGLLLTNQRITVDTGETVNVWILSSRDKAIDNKGFIYFCKYD